MRGSKRERPPGSGTWRLRVYAGRDPVSGKPRQVTRTVHGKRQKQADAILRKLVEEVEDGRRGGTTASLARLLDEWLEHAAGDLSPYTLRFYRGKVRSVIVPALGSVPLCDLTPTHLTKFYRDQRKAGKKAATVRVYHAIIHRALVYGQRWEWVDRNVADRVEPPRVHRDDTDIVAPTVVEVGKLVAAATEQDPRLGAFLAVAALTGARRGELCALRWSDVDLPRRELHVRRSTYEGRADDGGVQEKPTKSWRKRTVALDERAAAILAAHYTESAQRAVELESPLVADPYVFSPNLNGALMYRPSHITSAFAAVRDRLGMRHLHLHSLRHFAPTQLAAAGLGPGTIAARLGHDPTMTQRVYTHRDEAADRRAAEIMGQLLEAP